MSGPWLGVDLGGTLVKVVLLRDGVVSERATVPTVRGGAPATVAGLADVVAARVGREPGIAGVGITIPGLFDADGNAVVVPNLPGSWGGQPIVAPVAAAAGRPVTLINDARAFGLAELELGAARGADTAIGIVLGTGIGGVVIVGGRLHTGAGGGAGEIGHQVLVPDGPPCGCGNRGCLEALARSGVIAARAGTATIVEAVEAARAGEPRARAALEEAAAHLGHGLANAVTLLQPERVFIGGGVAEAGSILLRPIEEALRRMAPLPPPESYSVVPAALGSWAGAIGAALAASGAGRPSGIGT
ncbi:ROK family protein [Propioniciclava coleopterorum]|uniref:ROK family protein n=1 Tax=Propioniciclava coleopterorum TaxID=2714937 RepID=A0A6G7Y945_9ACTN|nr:ROK family protein [Propioniciclava coleopterorum]QIK73168.1 ROK family protein [Propioniciclava coleopterorum]